MARTVRDTNLETRTARLRLAIRGKPYWRVLESGLHMGYRRTKAGGGSWVARRFLGAGKYAETKLGLADDLQDADGHTVLGFGHAQEQARKWWKQEQHKDLGLEPETGPYTIADALRDYFDVRERRGSKGLSSDRKVAAARILPDLGAKEVGKLTTRIVREWHTGLAAAPKLVRTKAGAIVRATKPTHPNDQEAVRARRASANRVLTILKAALNHAFQDGRTASDESWRRVKPFRGVDTPVVRFLTQPECVRLLSASPEPFRSLVRAALLTGCRYGELTHMRVADFNRQARTVTVRHSKSGKPRHVALTDEGAQFCASLAFEGRPDDLLLSREGGAAWLASQQQRPLEKACRAARIIPAATFHILRHTYASRLAMRGVPMAVIAAQLGHADCRMTEKHYAHLAPNYVAETIRVNLPPLESVEAGSFKIVASS